MYATDSIWCMIRYLYGPLQMLYGLVNTRSQTELANFGILNLSARYLENYLSYTRGLKLGQLRGDFE